MGRWVGVGPVGSGGFSSEDVDRCLDEERLVGCFNI